jgi:hypothetical protein
VQDLIGVVNAQARQLQAQAGQLQAQAGQLQAQAGQLQAQVGQLQIQAEQVAAMQKTIDELKDEISRLNNTPKRPKFRSGGMEPRNRSKGTPPQNLNEANVSNQGVHNPKKVREEKRVPPVSIPEGSRFKGYQEFVVQEVELIAKDVVYKLEVWEAPDGTIHRGNLPAVLGGQHFGSELRTLIINLYAQCMTQPCILEFLQNIGIEVSTGQIHNILMQESKSFSSMSEDILSSGLREADYIETDDTAAKHKHKNGYCTYLGGKYFSYYKSSQSKSRENFLSILLQGKEGYHVNDTMIWHLTQCGVPDHILYLFEERQGKEYSSKQGFRRLLNALSVQGKKIIEHCIEAAAIGFISATILKKDQVLISDRAGQFSILNHAACWIHMERPLRKIPVTNDLVEKEVRMARDVIWKTYRKLKEPVRSDLWRKEVEILYDNITAMKSCSPKVTEVIANFQKYREELLKSLDYPAVPLHNNGSEQSIREMVKRRDVSGSTKSIEGQKFRDGLASIKQTCRKLGLSLYSFVRQYFEDGFIDLSNLVQQRYQHTLESQPVAMTF